MRKGYLCLALSLLVPFFLISCDNDNNSSDGRAISEKDLVSRPGTTADPEKDTVVMFLEPTSHPEENETGESGFDIFTYRYKRALSHTFCWKNPGESAGHFMEFTDSEGVEVLRVEANGECVTEVIPAGDYEVRLTHDNLTERVHPIFFQPDVDDKLTKQSGMLDKIGGYLTGMLAKLRVAEPSHAQSADDLAVLISNNSCFNCDLQNADLSGVDLRQADMRSANLEGANLAGSLLRGADLTGSDFFSSNLQNADFRFAKLTDSNLANANLTNTDFGGTDFEGALIARNTVSNTNFGSVVFENNRSFDLDLSNAILGCTTLPDGTVCTTGGDNSPGCASSDKFDCVSTLTCRNCDLTNADLSGRILNHANLTGSIMEMANLTGANLLFANLSSADLSGADFSDAILERADLRNSDLSNTDFSHADLFFTNLQGADITGSNIAEQFLDGTIWVNGCECISSCGCENCTMGIMCPVIPD